MMAFPVKASAAPTKQFTAWSYSRYAAYSKCPFAAKLSNLDKVQQPQSEPMKRGDEIHQLAAKYLDGRHAKLAPELRLFKALFSDLRRQRNKDEASVIVESSWAFRRDWSETTYDDWKNCWLRVKVDCARWVGSRLEVIDWKTGKFSPKFNLDDYLQQLELYALAALTLYAAKVPGLEVVPRLVYTDQGVVYPEPGAEGLEKIFTAADLPALRARWEARVKPLLSDKKFAPKPNQFCYSCHYRKANASAGGGQCQY